MCACMNQTPVSAKKNLEGGHIGVCAFVCLFYVCVHEPNARARKGPRGWNIGVCVFVCCVCLSVGVCVPVPHTRERK